MSWQIPNETRYTFRLHSKGIVVWSIQKALRDLGHVLAVDGNYGRKTEGHVATFQEDEGLLSDGIFGPESSQRLAAVLEDYAPAVVPKGLIRGFVEGESGGHVGAVNHSVAGGVDVSYLQRRILDGSDDATIQRGFNGLYQFTLVANTTKDRFNLYWPRSGVQTGAGPLAYIPTREEKAWRLAALAHNWPYAADRLSRGFWLSDKTAPWVPDGVTFADGQAVITYWDWARFYAIGSPEHGDPGSVTRFVDDWTE